jgi:uncharacterized protein YcbX
VPSVATISITPVKALALHHPDEIELGPGGVAGDRRYYVVDDGGRLVGGTKHGPLVRVRAEVEGDETLTLRFPDGDVVTAAVALGAELTTDFWGRPVTGRLLQGPWGDALSDYASRNLRLVHADSGDAWDVEPATLVSTASCERLGAELGAEVDPRRFRMLLTLDGCAPHEEDGWRDRAVSVGEAVLRIGGPVPRCAVTTQDPTTGVRSLDTLGAIKAYRGVREADGKSIDFGVYATVEQPGRVRVGDAVEPV